jgi:hypothetical protein
VKSFAIASLTEEVERIRSAADDVIVGTDGVSYELLTLLERLYDARGYLVNEAVRYLWKRRGVDDEPPTWLRVGVVMCAFALVPESFPVSVISGLL